MILAPFSRRALFGAAALLGPLLRPAAAQTVDPVVAAINTARRAGMALTAALTDLDEDDAAQNGRANAAADADSDARNALAKVLPTTDAGFRALVRFHAEDITFLEPDTFGALALRDIAAALEARGPS